MKKTPFICLLSALLLVTLLALPMTSLAEETEDIDVFALFAQAGLDLSPYEGKAIFMNFFTKWCGYCMKEMPDIKNAFDTYNPDEVEIILVHVWDGEDQTESDAVRETYGLHDMNIFEDKDFAVTQLVGLQGYPASLFIDKDGKLAGGYNYMLSEEMIEEIMTALDVSKKTP